jgi:hypothetical protein
MDKNAKVLEKKNIGGTFKALSTIRNSVKFVKNPIDPSNHKGVYMISCSCGKPYVGENSCLVSIRI